MICFCGRFIQKKKGDGLHIQSPHWVTPLYLNDLGFAPQVEHSEKPHDYYIPENIFYRLCMKARNAVAEAFQAKVADEDEKGVGKADTLGGSQEMTLISESGLYALVMRSNKPEAKLFKRWITHEVLPSIKKSQIATIQSDEKSGKKSANTSIFNFNADHNGIQCIQNTSATRPCDKVWFTAKQIEEWSGMSKSTLNRRLDKLEEVGRISTGSDLIQWSMSHEQGGSTPTNLYNLNVLNQNR